MINKETGKYHCNYCAKLFTVDDDILLIQKGYVLDNGQSYESHPEEPEYHYHEDCYTQMINDQMIEKVKEALLSKLPEA